MQDDQNDPISSFESANNATGIEPTKNRKSASQSLDVNAESYATVLHDYEPFRCDEIQLRSGEQIKVLSNDCRHSGGEGWWVGVESATGRIGVFPSAYVVLPHRALLHVVDEPKEHERLPRQTTLFTPNSSCSTSSSDQTTDRPVQLNTTIEAEKIVIASDHKEPCSNSDDQSAQAKVVLRNNAKRKQVFQVKTIPSSEIVRQQSIGSGAFGIVYRGLWGDRDVALKVLNLSTSQVDKEASHLCQLSHKNVVQFFGVCELASHNVPALVMEFAYGGPLNAVLMQHPILGPSTLLDWAIQVATGMAYLHTDARLVHRDLKSANILIREPITTPYSEDQLRRCTLVITDFGMACRSSELDPQQSKLGTVAYAAPEVCRQAGFSFKSDVWSYGVVLWELLTLEVPFRMMEQPRLMYIIAMYNYTLYIPDDVPDLFSKLLRDCWSPEPENRPSFEDIIARLQLTSFCNFLSMDSEELSHIQAGWRESILAHHRAEQESAAATLSSSMTRSQLAMVEEDLALQMELLRHERESLDRERQELAERAHLINLKEESYNRMVGTMGPQFMLMAVLAANQLKKIPCQTHPRPPPPRKRPFMLSLFRRWGSTGESTAHKAATLTGTATGRDRKASAGSQHGPSARNNSQSSLALSSESLVTNASRFGCSRGGIPLISPPVNMKHVVHVDPDWLIGCGLSDSSMNLFPAAMVDRFSDSQPDVLNASLRSSNRTGFPINSPNCVPSQHTSPCTCVPSLIPDGHSHFDPNTSAYSSGRPSQANTNPRVPQNLWDPVDPHQFAAWYQPVDPPNSRLNNLPKVDRGVPRLLRKNAQTTQQHPVTFTDSIDVFSTTSSVAVGSSHFFTPVRTDCSMSSVADSSGSRGTEQASRGSAKPFPPFLLSSSSGNCFATSTGDEAEKGSNSTDSSPSDRRRFISGPAMPNLPLWASVDPIAECNCSRCGNCHAPTFHSPRPPETDPQSIRDRLHLLCSVHPPSNWPFVTLPSAGSNPQITSTPDVQKLLSRSVDESKPTPCVEHALWSAFQLAASFSCMPGSWNDASSAFFDLISSHYSGNKPAGILQKPLRSDELCASENNTANGSGTTGSRRRFGRTKNVKRWNGKSRERTHNEHLPGSTTNVPFTDSRRRFQSADRSGRSQASCTSVCSACNGMAALPELIDECIARQAEFGDPHSPFLGMLAGSGRRPTASATQPGDRRFPPRPGIQFPNHDSTLGHTPCNHSRLADHFSVEPSSTTDHGWARASFDVLPHSSSTIARATNPHFNHRSGKANQNKSTSNLPDSPHRRYDDSSRRQQSIGDVNAVGAIYKLDQSEPGPRDSIVWPLTFNPPRLRSAEQQAARSPNLRTSSDFASDPASALTSYNPVAVSRDAYLKATKDGYLNRTAESPNPVADDGALNPLRTSPFPGPNRSFYNPGFYAQSVGSLTTLNPTEVEQLLRHKGPGVVEEEEDRVVRKEHVDDRPHSSDSDEEAEDPGVYQMHTDRQSHEEEGDGVTLVPIDCWGPQFDENKNAVPPAVPPRSANRLQLTKFPSISSSMSRFPTQTTGSPRRLIHRSPAMRELRRPDFVRNRSVPETHTPTWSRQIDASNHLSHEASFSDRGNGNTDRTDSPCGPFVSLHSAFL